YYLKGSLGTGKSTFMKRIMEIANMEDYHLEIYWNSFAPEKIESLLIYELDLIISSNDKVRKGEYQTIDFGQYFTMSKVDNSDYRMFEKLLSKGTKGLKGAARNHLAQENIYNNAIDFDGINKERESIWKEIKRYI